MKTDSFYRRLNPKSSRIQFWDDIFGRPIVWVMIFMGILMLSMVSVVSAEKYHVDLPIDLNDNLIYEFDNYTIETSLDSFLIKWNNGNNLRNSRGQSFSANVESKSSRYNDILEDTDLELIVEENQLKENIILHSKPFPGNGVGGDIAFVLQMDIDERLTINANGQMYELDEDFVTSDSIVFYHEGVPRITLPRPFAFDNNGDRIDLSYEYESSAFLGLFFRRSYISVLVPKDYLNNAAYPVTIDPTAVAGCVDAGDTIECHSGVFAGDYIDTDKNISILSATMNAVADISGNKHFFLNTSAGWIQINDSTVNTFGDGGPLNGNGWFQIADGAPQGVIIKNSVINAYGGSGGCGASNQNGGAGLVQIDEVGNVTIYGTTTFNGYGGIGCGSGGNGGTGGSGNWVSNSLGTLTFDSGAITLDMDGGPGGVACAAAGCFIGGGSVVIFNEADVQGLTSSVTVLNSAGAHAECGGETGTGASAEFRTTSSGLFNWSGDITTNGGTGCTATGSEIFRFQNDSGKLRMNDGTYTGSPVCSVAGTEFTLFDYSFTSTSPVINITQDIGRIGVFGTSSRTAADVNYFGSIGTIIVNNTDTDTLNNVTLDLRPLTTYYNDVIVTLDSPADSATIAQGNIDFEFTSYALNGLKNASLLVNGISQEDFIITGASNTSASTVNLATGDYNWSVHACDVNDDCITSNERSLFVRLLTINSQTFESSVFETSTQEFEINISYDSAFFTNVEAVLNYNGTQVFGSTPDTGSNRIFTASLDVPSIGSPTEVKQFFWEFNVINGTTPNYFNSTTSNQTITQLNIVACGSGTPILNFTSARERNLTVIDPFYFEASLQFYVGDGNERKNVTIPQSLVSSQAICASPAPESLKVAGVVAYDGQTSGDYIPREYLFDGTELTNTSVEDITLYLLDASSSTSFILKVQDQNIIPITGALISIERFYPGLNEYRTVQVARTDDDGKSVGFYEVEVVDYRHTITKNGTTLLVTTPQKIVGEETPFTLTFTVGDIVTDPLAAFGDIDNLDGTLSFNSTSNIVALNWQDTSGDFTEMELVVIELGSPSDTEICRLDSILSSGELICDLSSKTGVFYVTAWLTRDSVQLENPIAIIQFTINDNTNIFGKTGLFLAWFIILAAAMVGIWNPVAGVILTNMAVILVNIIGIATFSPIFIFGLIALSVLTIILLKT